MQVVELASIIFALSMDLLVDIIFVQSLKATSKEKMVWLDSYGFVVARASKKLHCLIGPTHFGVSALLPKDQGMQMLK